MDIINDKLIKLNLKVNTQLEAIEELTKLLYNTNRITSEDVFIKGVLDREKAITTGFGNGIAIPHCKSECVLNPSIAIGKSINPLEWNALDDKPVNFIILLAVPKKDSGTMHLRLLSRLSEKLMDDEFRTALKNANTSNEILVLLNNINILNKH
ncbi:PTS sugar transporter subunit IIA [Caldisalinibacter kiritimatiensis]|uniref:PTS system, fructose-specific IIABC component n=1 Tax=Caldisalinibacter kiritimatiensis TaxID=1304284 RepID=R1CML5_9FIRM|nr:fructose PTS transporter subunit IIA [Caldisalinibacter kiritimatiensis]EOC99940.1 PTS system, fructose-specific IIABC component [Caldisalinibacter kiritimatiensis]